jgi:hypothetical protein
MCGDTNRTLCRLSRVRMLMHGECNRRPEGQQHAQTRNSLRYRPHDGYSVEAFSESIPKRQTNAKREYLRRYVLRTVCNANAPREFETLSTANAWLILFGLTKQPLQVVQITSVLSLMASSASGGERQDPSKSPTR